MAFNPTFHALHQRANFFRTHLGNMALNQQYTLFRELPPEAGDDEVQRLAERVRAIADVLDLLYHVPNAEINRQAQDAFEDILNEAHRLFEEEEWAAAWLKKQRVVLPGTEEVSF